MLLVHTLSPRRDSKAVLNMQVAWHAYGLLWLLRQRLRRWWGRWLQLLYFHLHLLGVLLALYLFVPKPAHDNLLLHTLLA